MGFAYIFAGFVFLFNPNFNILDVLPDFIGCALIIYGMAKLRDFAPALADSRAAFTRLMFASAAKTAVNFIMPGLSDQGYLLVFTFVFTLIEVAFLLPAMTNFFEGMFFVGTVYDGGAMVGELTRAKTISVVFVISRGVLTLLPEFVYLYVDESIGYVLAAYKTPLMIISLLLSAAIGIAWLVEMKKFFGLVRADVNFIGRIETYYREYIAPNANMFLRRAMKNAMTFFIIGTVFLCDLCIDGIDILPDPIGAAMLIIGIMLIRKYTPEYKPVLYALCGYFALSTAAWLYNRGFAVEYYASGVSRSVEAYRMFTINSAIQIVGAVLLSAVIIMFGGYLSTVIKLHTGRDLQSEFASVREKEEAVKRSLNVKCAVFTVFGVIAALSCAVNMVCLYKFEEYWMINSVINIIWIVTVSKLTYDLNYRIEEKYM